MFTEFKNMAGGVLFIAYLAETGWLPPTVSGSAHIVTIS